MAKFYNASLKSFDKARAQHGVPTVYVKLPEDQAALRRQHIIWCGQELINRAIDCGLCDAIDEDLGKLTRGHTARNWRRTIPLDGRRYYTAADVFSDLYTKILTLRPGTDEYGDLPEAMLNRWNEFFVECCDWPDFEIQHIFHSQEKNKFSSLFSVYAGAR
jgi:hypothetical protein